MLWRLSVREQEREQERERGHCAAQACGDGDSGYSNAAAAAAFSTALTQWSSLSTDLRDVREARVVLRLETLTVGLLGEVLAKPRVGRASLRPARNSTSWA